MGALVTVMVSPHLTDGCAVAKDAVAALVADGWTPPERLPGFEDPQCPAAQADHEQHEAGQNHAAGNGAHRAIGTDRQERDRDAGNHDQQTSSDETPAPAPGRGLPHVIHGPSLTQGAAA